MPRPRSPTLVRSLVFGGRHLRLVKPFLPLPLLPTARWIEGNSRIQACVGAESMHPVETRMPSMTKMLGWSDSHYYGVDPLPLDGLMGPRPPKHHASTKGRLLLEICTPSQRIQYLLAVGRPRHLILSIHPSRIMLDWLFNSPRVCPRRSLRATR